MRKLKKVVASLLVTCAVVTTPLTAFAAHNHSWGPTMYYGYIDDEPLPWEDRCVIRHIYIYHTCLTCGESEIWESNSYEMEHKFVNNSCIYCGLTYLRDVAE